MRHSNRGGGGGGGGGSGSGSLMRKKKTERKRDSTFLTSLASGESDDESQSPMRGRIRGGARGGARARGASDRGGSLNTSRGLGGHNRELFGVGQRTALKRTVRSAPAIKTMTSLRLSPEGKKKRVAWMQQPVLQKQKRGGKRGVNTQQGQSSSSTMQKSRNQLSKLTEQSRSRRRKREAREVEESSVEMSIESKGARRAERAEKEEVDGVDGVEEEDEDLGFTSSTFLTGSDLMINSPPKRGYRPLALSQRIRGGVGGNKGGHSSEEENDENLSLTFLTSGAINSPDSPRISKRVKGKRQQRRSQNSNIVKRSLGKAVW